MAALASSTNSSIDLLAAGIDDPRFSPVRPQSRIFQRSPSPFKPLKATTPTRNEVYQLQDFYLDTPGAGRITRESPARSVTEAEKNLISPWRIRVRVEAERDDNAAQDNRPDRLKGRSMSASKTRTRATTTVVPLNDDSDSSEAAKKPKRNKKSTPRRPPTPRTTRNKKRVLDEVENESTQRQDTPKRSKRQGTPRNDHSIQPSIEDDSEQTILQLDDLLEAAVMADHDKQENEAQGIQKSAGKQDISHDHDNVRQSNEPAMKRLKSASSPFKFRRQGHDVSIVQTKTAASSPGKARRRLLISDFAEPQPEFDSMVEGEDFSMVSLSSVPSAQQHLSLRKENQPAITPGQKEAGSPRRIRSPPHDTTSPIVTAPNGVFKSQYAGRRTPKSKPINDTILFSSAQKESQPSPKPLRAERQFRPVYETSGTAPGTALSGSQSDGDSSHPAELGNQDDVQPKEVGGDEEIDYPYLDDIGDGFGSDYDDQQVDDAEGEVIQDAEMVDGEDVQTVEQDFARDPEFSEQELPPPPSPPPITEDYDKTRNKLEFVNHKDSSNRQAYEVPTRSSPVSASRDSQVRTSINQPNQTLDQSSMLQLPQKTRTPSKIFSSPVLPNLPSPHDKAVRQLPNHKGHGPRLSRVVKAGQLLQGVVETNSERGSRQPSEQYVRQNSQNRQEEDLFSGFSTASRRELRAGLRLGEELAKRQSSMLDVTMHTVYTEPSHQTPDSARPVTPLASQSINRPEISYPGLRKEVTRQLLSPETSSNDTEDRRRSLLQFQPVTEDHTKDYIHEDTRPDVAARPVAVPEAQQQRQQQQQQQPAIESEDESDVHSGEGHEDQIGDQFAEDSEVDEEPHQAFDDETDIWQLEAKSTSILRESLRSNRQSVNSEVHRRSHGSQPQSSASDDPASYDPDFDREEEDDQDFDEELMSQSPTHEDLAKPVDTFTPSVAASSPVYGPKANGVEFTNFTGFTQDLLQAAKRQPRKIARIEEEQEQQTPQRPSFRDNHDMDLEAFTTNSLLETSAASVRPLKAQARRPISFRPTNRKESWLFDPARARKPPSPVKTLVEASPRRAKAQALSPVINLLPAPRDPSKNRDVGKIVDDRPNPSFPVRRAASTHHELTATPSPRLAESSPLSIFVAAQQRRAQQITKDVQQPPEMKKPSVPERPVATPRHVPTTKPAQQQLRSILKPQQRRNIHAVDQSSSRPSSRGLHSGTNSQQSSFVSNATTHTSYDEEEEEEEDLPQQSWLSLLASAATPIITSTTALTNFAVQAFQHSQQKTFYPALPSATNATQAEPAELTTHLPFNETHWLALRSLYTAAAKDPGKYALSPTHPLAQYLDLEIQSHGWKRCLAEWELSVAAAFLEVLERDGVDIDAGQEIIDVDTVVLRVFSLWVGMVIKGECELNDGVAGAWDRRFVWRREGVLRRQKAWIKAREQGQDGCDVS